MARTYNEPVTYDLNMYDYTAGQNTPISSGPTATTPNITATSSSGVSMTGTVNSTPRITATSSNEPSMTGTSSSTPTITPGG